MSDRRQVFWAIDWSVFRKGRAVLTKAGFTVTTVKGVNKDNGMTIYYAFVPPSEFRKANKIVRTF